MMVQYLSLFAAAFSPLATADEFFTPSQKQTNEYALGQTVQLSWNTSFDEISLFLFHQNQSEILGTIFSNIPNPSTYSWIIGQHDHVDDQQIASSDKFVLKIVNTGNATNQAHQAFSSSEFIIKSTNEQGGSPSTVTPESKLNRSSIATSITTHGLRTGAKVGIGLGVTTGVLSLLALSFLVTIYAINVSRARKVKVIQKIGDTHGIRYSASPTQKVPDVTNATKMIG